MSGKNALLQPPPQNGRRIKQKSNANIIVKKPISADDIDIEVFGQLTIDSISDGKLISGLLQTSGTVTTGGSQSKGTGGGGGGGATNKDKASLQKLASSFLELNKRKAEKREKEQETQETWKTLIESVRNLQKGKIPLLLAVEAGNQSMCRELLSAQTAEQLKVSAKHSFFFLIEIMCNTCFDNKSVSFICFPSFIIYFYYMSLLFTIT